MKSNYLSASLPAIEKDLSTKRPSVTLSGNNLTVSEIIAASRLGVKVSLSEAPEIVKRIKSSYDLMMKQVKEGIPIYGCNTGYGGRAAVVLTEGSAQERLEIARQFSDGIVHVDVSVGPEFTKDIVRGAMLIRINMLMQGVSAIRYEDLQLYKDVLNADITPVVNQYGGIGASGDLAHNGRLVSMLRQLPDVVVTDKKGNRGEAQSVLSGAGFQPLILEPKAGLGLVNGDNFSTSLATMLAYDTLQLLLIQTVLGAMVVEVLRGSDRSFHPLLAGVRPHPGQKEVAELYRYLLDGSKLAYQEMRGHVKRDPGVSVQDGYSLRGISQYHGVNFEKIKSALDTIERNANSVSDNPLWVTEEFATEGEEPGQWVSGGNFIACHMVEVMDGLRKTITQIVKLNDRHLARMVTPHHSNGLPANLSEPDAITQCVFKGTQTQSGMMEIYSSLLSIPVSTFFGVHEEANQDITSHALTSGILGLENLRLARYSTAQNLVAVAQAVDLRGGPEKLSPHTKPMYDLVRSHTRHVTQERPLNNDIESIYQAMVNGSLMDVVRTIFTEK